MCVFYGEDFQRNFQRIVPLFQNESKRETMLMKMTDLHENEPVGGTRFHMNGFALRLFLTQRQKGIRK